MTAPASVRLFPLLCLLVYCCPIAAQSPALSMRQVVEKVAAAVPQLEAARQEAAATRENIRLAHNTLVPDVTAGYQLNTATYNNITGMSYPGFLLPISGPPSPGNQLNFVPGSALGVLARWSPVTFGQRQAAIGTATAQYNQREAAYNNLVFGTACRALMLYLDALYLQQLMRNYRAAIERNQAGLEQALVLANTGLRAGIDTAQFQSAVAQGEIDYLQTEQAWKEKLAELKSLTGLSNNPADLVLSDSLFSRLPAMIPDTTRFWDQHPAYRAAEAQRAAMLAALKEVQRSWLPRLELWGNAYGRGSGIDARGGVNKPDGFRLSRTNLGAGLQLSVPLLGFSAASLRKRQAGWLLRADEARVAQTKIDLSEQMQKAVIQFQQSAKIAQQTPVLVRSATATYEGLKISYASGLIDYTRLAQGTYDLLKADVSLAGARLQYWRALLSIAIAKGDLSLFLSQTH